MEVHENQRFWLVWCPPWSLVERPAWSDASGNATSLADNQLPPAAPDCWDLVVTPATDAQGWSYGTIFSHLNARRPGGRASKRLEDLVRRRVWRCRGALPPPAAEPAVAAEGVSSQEGTAEGGSSGEVAVSRGDEEPAATAAAAAAAAATAAAEPATAAPAAAVAAAALSPEASAWQQAHELLQAMRRSILQRRRPWNILPWGPPAVSELRQQHQQVLGELQAQARARRQLLPRGGPAPRSPLRPGTRTLVQELRAGALHAKAAYGFAAAAGYLDSVRLYIRLRTWKRLMFDAVGGASAEANEEAVAEVAGLVPGDILISCWRNSALQPCFYVAIDSANECVVLAVRGSLEDGDWLSDFCALPTPVELGGRSGWVHSGMLEAARYVLSSSRAALEEAARRVPGWPLLLAGHSLGGGVAALVTWLLQQEGGPPGPPGLGPMHCVALGPAAVLSAPLAARCKGLVTSVVVGADQVPALSCCSVETLMLELSRTSPGRQAVGRLNQRLAQALSIPPEEALKEEDFESLSALGWAAGRIAVSLADAGARGLGTLVTSYFKWVEEQPSVQWMPQMGLTGGGPGPAAGTSAGPSQLQQGSSSAEGLLGAEEAAGPPCFSSDSSGGEGEGQLSDDELSLLTELVVADMADSELAVEARTAGGGGAGTGGGRAGAALAAAVAAVADPDSAHPEHLYPPGRVLWIVLPGGSTGGDTGLAAAAAEVAAGAAEGVAAAAIQAVAPGASSGQEGGSVALSGAEGISSPTVQAASSGPAGESVVAALVDRSTFDRILLLPEALSDHLLSSYMRVLEALEAA